MTAPEKIWMGVAGRAFWPGSEKHSENDVQYTRTDLCLELVAAAYEDAAVIALSCQMLTPDPDKVIRNRTPADAQAALAARDARIREAAVREAAEWVEQFAAISEPDDLKDAILALISKDKANG